jgi:hypothetical protein
MVLVEFHPDFSGDEKFSCCGVSANWGYLGRKVKFTLLIKPDGECLQGHTIITLL